MCSAGDGFNLLYASLKSEEALRLLRDVQRHQPDLWAKITSAQHPVAEADDDLPTVNECHDNDDDNGEDDDDVELEVPVDIVLEWMHSGGKVIPDGYIIGPDGALRAHNASEDALIDAEQPSDVEELVGAPEYGRGKRRNIGNKYYSTGKFFRH